MDNKYQLCQELFSSRKELVAHERIRHRNNKTIPYRKLLTQPPLDQRLGFNRHLIGAKQFSINAFPENIFVYLFENEPSFRYSPVQRKYSCFFQSEADYESSYEVNFSWSQSEFKENNHIFQCGTTTCKFTADSGEFSEQREWIRAYEGMTKDIQIWLKVILAQSHGKHMGR
ncbi:5425_t:CDS:2, partial [Gigaspora rosea]